MALALYRKYRPATFAQVVGQEHVTEPLRNALSSGRINHAYLFSGPRGCGKTSSARIMARSLNCVQGPTADPCGVCNSCVGLAPEGPGTIDVVEMDAASHGGVDDARELRDKAFYAPAESRYRVFIIDEAHMVTTQGFNALLKIVEEPPEHLIFIFATTEPEKVLPTIRSRTHHYPFRLIPPGPMRELVERNSAAEGVAVEPAVFPLVIRAGGGSARDTQSVLDQLLAGAGPDGVTYQMAMTLLGVTDVALLDEMVLGLADGDGERVFGTVEQLVDAGHDPRRFAADLLDRFRDLLLLRVVPDSASRLITASGDELEAMIDQAQKLPPGTLTRFAEIMHTGLTEMRGATAPRLLLELLCSRMLLPAAVGAGSAAAEASEAAVDSAVLHRLERLERRIAVGVTVPDATPSVPDRAGTEARPAARRTPETAEPASAPPVGSASSTGSAPSTTDTAAAPTLATPVAAPEPPAPAPVTEPSTSDTSPAVTPGPEPEPPDVPEPAGAPGGMDAAGLRRVWPDIRAAVRGSSRSVEAMLSNAGVQSVQGNTVVLGHTATPLVRRLSEQRNVDVLAAALAAVLGGEWQVRWVHSGQENMTSAPAKPAAKAAPTRPQRPAAAPEPPRDAPPAREPEAAAPAPQSPPERPRPRQEPDRDAIPPPEEPPDDEPPPEDYRPAEAPVAARNPAADAIDLLSEKLGARRIEER